MSVVQSKNIEPKDFVLKDLRYQVGPSGFEKNICAQLSVDRNETVVIVGESGLGKTTLLRVICGLYPKISGEIFLNGQALSQTLPEKREIGMVFQDPSLFSRLSVLENARFGLDVRRVSDSVSLEQTLLWLRKVGLENHLKTPVEHLSGGEKQRVALVRALIWKPKLLLLDEPFSALDPDTKTSTFDTLRELRSEHPVPTVVVTHHRGDWSGHANAFVEFKNWVK